MSLYQAYGTSKLGLTYITGGNNSSAAVGSGGQVPLFQLCPVDNTFVPTSFAIQIFDSDTGVKFVQSSLPTAAAGVDPGGLLLTDGVIWRVDVETISEAYLHMYRTGSASTVVEITQISRTSGPRTGTGHTNRTY